jgi:hypothetical protein
LAAEPHRRRRPGIALRARIRSPSSPARASPRFVGDAPPAPQSISRFFLNRAPPEGGGTNVINVMLVDVRSLELALSCGHATAQTFVFRPTT